MAFYPLEKLINLRDGYRRVFRVAGVDLLLIQDQGECFLIRDLCPHKDFPLHTGQLRRGILQCAYHGMAFSLRSGECVMQPGVKALCLTRYVLVYEGSTVGVEL